MSGKPLSNYSFVLLLLIVMYLVIVLTVQDTNVGCLICFNIIRIFVRFFAIDIETFTLFASVTNIWLFGCFSGCLNRGHDNFAG
jgi:hypothetical protein